MGKSMVRPPNAKVYEKEKSAVGLNIFSASFKANLLFARGIFFCLSTKFCCIASSI